jgi:DNA-directed RNA polymerase sigma subunit (sigma70/sigma32)
MKHKHFYTHLVENTDITLELAELDLTADERVHLLSLVEANIHTTVVDTILSELPEEEKKVFLKNLALDDHEKTLNHLKEKISGVEEKIKNSAANIKKELKENIRDIKA